MAKGLSRPPYIPDDLLTPKDQIRSFAKIAGAFRTKLGGLTGSYVFARCLFRMAIIKRQIDRLYPDLPKDRDQQALIQMVALITATYRELLRRHTSEAAAYATTKEVLIAPLSRHIIDAISPNRDMPFPQFVSYFKWGFQAMEDLIDTAPVEDDGQTYAFNITSCMNAQIFSALGTPEAAPLMCAMDHEMYDALSTLSVDVTSTIAKGATTCDFRFTAEAQLEGDAPPAR